MRHINRALYATTELVLSRIHNLQTNIGRLRVSFTKHRYPFHRLYSLARVDQKIWHVFHKLLTLYNLKRKLLHFPRALPVKINSISFSFFLRDKAWSIFGALNVKGKSMMLDAVHHLSKIPVDLLLGKKYHWIFNKKRKRNGWSSVLQRKCAETERENYDCSLTNKLIKFDQPARQADAKS